MDNRVNVYGALPRAIADCTGGASLMAEVLDSLTFDSARAGLALSDRSVCATDLAERLTMQTGIDFRTAHNLVGRLVSRLEEQFRTLAGATTEDIAAVASEMTGLPIEVEAKLLAQAIDPIAGIAARNGLGGCAPEEVRAMVEDLNRNLTRHRSWIDMKRDKQRQALTALLDEARTFAQVIR
jgi:argininosuccinate lyase